MNRKISVHQPPILKRRASEQPPRSQIAAGDSRVHVVYRDVDMAEIRLEKGMSFTNYDQCTYLRRGPTRDVNPCRKLLVEEMPPGGYLPRYERDTVKSYVIPKRGPVPKSVQETPNLEVPDLNLALTLIEEHEKLGVTIKFPIPEQRVARFTMSENW